MPPTAADHHPRIDAARTGLPVDWDLARRTAVRLVPGGPAVAAAEAQELVARLRADATVAEGHVRAVTGLGTGLPLLPADVVDRPAWATAAVHGMAELTAGARLPDVPRVARAITSTTAGLQVGGVHVGRDEQRALDVPAEDFAMWVCLHEATHRLQFTAVPWLREHFADEVSRFLSISELGRGGVLERLPEAVRALREAHGDALALVEVLQGPEQRAVLDRLLALTTLLEGHADHVMDAAGPDVVPSVATIRARFTVRRRGGGLIDRVLRALLGVEAKVRQYAVGSAFTRHVIDAVGMDGFNQVWSSPEALPTRAELADPSAWLRRVA